MSQRAKDLELRLRVRHAARAQALADYWLEVGLVAQGLLDLDDPDTIAGLETSIAAVGRTIDDAVQDCGLLEQLLAGGPDLDPVHARLVERGWLPPDAPTNPAPTVRDTSSPVGRRTNVRREE